MISNRLSFAHTLTLFLLNFHKYLIPFLHSRLLFFRIISHSNTIHSRYIWHRQSKILGTSHGEVEWEIPPGTPAGTYRLHHYGNYKYVLGGIYPYHGFSDSFQVS